MVGVRANELNKRQIAFFTFIRDSEHRAAGLRPDGMPLSYWMEDRKKKVQ